MKKLFLVAGLALSFAGCVDSKSDEKQDEKKEASQNTLTDDEKKDGWQLLFDGTSTKGWYKYGDTAIGAAWKADSGTLRLDASQRQDWQLVAPAREPSAD